MRRREPDDGRTLALTLSGCAEPPCANPDNDRMKMLMKPGVPVYAVRRPGERRHTGVVAASRLPGFRPRFTAEAGKDDPVILICRTDKLARELMEKHGYTQVHNVRRGITRRIAAGNPVVKN